jgi:hypothetical protein
VPEFVASVADCEAARAVRIGQFDGDGNRIALFVIKPARARSASDGAESG